MSLLERHRRLARGEPSPCDRLLEPLLAPLALVYGAAAAVRNAAYDARLLPSRRAPVWTISIGGLSAGGTGKTPLAADLACRLRAWGHRPLLVARGWGARSPLRDACMVSGEPGRIAGWRSVGEEAVLLARLAPGVPVCASPRRERALPAARAAGRDPDVLVLDGAFQYRRLIADLALVSVDASRPPGRGRLLPWGDLREPWHALTRAGFLVLYRAERGADLDGWRRFLGRSAPGVPYAIVANRWTGLARLADREPLDWARAVHMRWGVWLALADPRPFLTELAARGIDPLAVECAPDHAPLDERAARRFVRAALDGLIVSEKDAVKLEGDLGGLPPVHVVSAKPEWLEGLPALEERLRASRESREARF